MPDQAKAKARQLLDTFAPFAERGICIVGLEPSCLLTMRDEMLVMNLGKRATTLADHALLFEEFIAREARAGRLALPLKPAIQPMRREFIWTRWHSVTSSPEAGS